MKHRHRFFTALVAMIVLFSCCGKFTAEDTLTQPMKANAVSVDYPMQLMNIATKDHTKVLTEDGTKDGATLSVKALGNDLSSAWRFDMVGTDAKGTFFKLCNAESGRLVTPQGYSVTDGAAVILYGSESHQCQHWYVIPVQNDRLGNGLYYKIVNYKNTELALTQSSTGMTLSQYTGADQQLWLLNSDGLQGFAGYCFDDNTGAIKAGTIGGLFGEVVEASTFDELKKYATSDTPYTIVVTNNISITNLTMDSQNHYYCPDGRIYVHNNKTIIGSYGAHTLNNVQFCTASKNGVGNNIIIKNFDLQHDAKSNGNDSIVVYFGSGENLWVDHVTFTGHSAVNTQGENVPDWDKFLACCYDADYCTVSDCSFGLHEYGLILGYPADDDKSYQNYNNFPRMSLIGNQFHNTITRGPGLMRYGYFHSLNNYVDTFSMAYTVHTASKIFAENCYYDGGSINGNVICDWNTVTYPGSYAETGSKFTNCKRTTIEGQAQNCTWRPTSNYSYVSRSADAAKDYCNTYAACQNAPNTMMYLRYAKAGVPSAGFNTAPDAPMTSETTTTSTSTTTTTTTTAPIIIEPMNGVLIQNLVVEDIENHMDWSIVQNMRSGDPLYGDRDVVYLTLPTALEGAEAIRTACDSKNSTSNLASFIAAEDVTVYVAFDTRVDPLPDWIQSYTPTTLTTANNNDVSFNFYIKDYAAGETVTLGQNGQSSYCVNYTVFVTRQVKETTTAETTTTASVVTHTLLGDVDCNGEVSISDAIMLCRYNAEDDVAITAVGLLNADCNLDGITTAEDVTLILQVIAKLIVLE